MRWRVSVCTVLWEALWAGRDTWQAGSGPTPVKDGLFLRTSPMMAS